MSNQLHQLLAELFVDEIEVSSAYTVGHVLEQLRLVQQRASQVAKFRNIFVYSCEISPPR